MKAQMKEIWDGNRCDLYAVGPKVTKAYLSDVHWERINGFDCIVSGKRAIGFAPEKLAWLQPLPGESQECDLGNVDAFLEFDGKEWILK